MLWFNDSCERWCWNGIGANIITTINAYQPHPPLSA